MAKGIKFKNTYVAPYFPIGFTILMANDTDPSTWLGGTWQRVAKGKAIVGVDEDDTDFNTVGKTGGSKYLQAHIHKLMQFLFNGGSSTGTHYGCSWSVDPGNLFESGNITAVPSYVGEVKNTTTGNSGNLQPYMTFYIWTRIK